MPISDVSARELSVPIEYPHRDRGGKFSVVWVTVEADDDELGWGYTGMTASDAITSYINEKIAPLLKGQDPARTEFLWDRLRRKLNRSHQTGIWARAVSAVDIALWDLKGKQLGVPVWKLLGGTHPEIPAYVTFGDTSQSSSDLVAEAENYVERGVEGLKMKVGDPEHNSLVEDASRVREVRNAVGPDIELMVDADKKFSVEEALNFCRELGSTQIEYLEEPIYANDPQLLATLRDRTDIPIAAGQTEGNKLRYRALIEAGAVDIIQPNVSFSGGFTEGAKIAALAESHNMRIATGGGWALPNLHLQAGVTNGTATEYHIIIWESDRHLFESVPEPTGGGIELPKEPGLGLTPDWDAVDEYSVK